MLSIRRNVFETNSSSSHSLSIVTYEKPKTDKIPRNAESYKVEELGGYDFEIYSEVEKLSFMLNVIATYIRNHTKFGVEETFEEMIKREPFVWLQEMVKEETGTTIEFIDPEEKWHPYFETLDDECFTIEKVFECDWSNEQEFKKYMKELIFDNNKGISYEEDKW